MNPASAVANLLEMVKISALVQYIALDFRFVQEGQVGNSLNLRDRKTESIGRLVKIVQTFLICVLNRMQFTSYPRKSN